MLTGATEPTHGHAFVMGFSLTTDAATLQALQYISLCPQFDVFWPSLSAHQHLWIVSMLKGQWRPAPGPGGGDGAAPGTATDGAADGSADACGDGAVASAVDERSDGRSSGTRGALRCAFCCGAARRRIAAHVAERLELVGLSAARDQRVDTFSGGMKRRLSCAMAACGDPRIIFFDEPTTGI